MIVECMFLVLRLFSNMQETLKKRVFTEDLIYEAFQTGTENLLKLFNNKQSPMSQI